MYIESRRSWYTNNGQRASGSFLVIVCDPFNAAALRPELRAFVRHVRLNQLGHWMMGNVVIAGFRLTLSGTYGSDGLPYSFRDYRAGEDEKGDYIFKAFTDEEKKRLWDQLTPLPPELQEEFWAGGGHNSAGKEGPSIQKWAKENIQKLRKRIK